MKQEKYFTTAAATAVTARTATTNVSRLKMHVSAGDIHFEPQNSFMLITIDNNH